MVLPGEKDTYRGCIGHRAFADTPEHGLEHPLLMGVYGALYALVKVVPPTSTFSTTSEVDCGSITFWAFVCLVTDLILRQLHVKCLLG